MRKRCVGELGQTASKRVGAPGPFDIHTLHLAYFNDGTRIWNGDAAETAGAIVKDLAAL